MSTHETPLFANRPFTVAQGRELGIASGILRSKRYAKPFHGVRSPHLCEAPATTEQRVVTMARNLQPLLAQSSMFSGETALFLYGCPVRVREHVHVSVRYPTNAPSRAGVIGHQHYADYPVFTTKNGLFVPSPARALVQAAATLDLTELIIAVDHLVNAGRYRQSPIIERELLGEQLRLLRNRGVKRAREAWRHSRVGAESRMETLLRLGLARRGIVDLDLQVEIFDDDGIIGRFDLADRTSHTIYEYDGEQHRLDRSQYLKDITRHERVQAAGWRVVRFHAEDFNGRDDWSDRLGPHARSIEASTHE